MTGEDEATAKALIANTTRHLTAVAAIAKVGTIHASHDGWDWLEDRVLRCSCGTALVNPPAPLAQESTR